MSDHTPTRHTLTDADVDVQIEAAHPSRPDRHALVREHMERLLVERGGNTANTHEIARRDLMRRIGFGDGITEPMADNDTVVEFIEAAVMDQSEHRECPIVCELCGERLADKPCPHCGGCGANVALTTAALAYAECEWCAGAGKVHEGCAEKTYAELVAERDEARATVEQAATPSTNPAIGWTDTDGTYHHAPEWERRAATALAETLCREYHPMHWDVAYSNRNTACGACKTHAARFLAAGWHFVPPIEGLPDCEGWACQSCGADNFIPNGYVRTADSEGTTRD